MSDYIKREDAIKAFEPKRRQDWYTPWIVETLEDLPPADVAPIRRGHWIEDQDRIICSECGARFRDEIIYMQENKPGAPHRCLECGAIMDRVCRLMDRKRPMYNRMPSYIVIEITQDADGNHIPVRFYNEQAIDLFIQRQSEAVYELKKYMECDEEASE